MTQDNAMMVRLEKEDKPLLKQVAMILTEKGIRGPNGRSLTTGDVVRASLCFLISEHDVHSQGDFDFSTQAEAFAAELDDNAKRISEVAMRLRIRHGVSNEEEKEDDG